VVCNQSQPDVVAVAIRLNEIFALYIAFECVTGTVLLNGGYSGTIALLHSGT